MKKKKCITRNYMTGGLTVFLQRHICEMDLETSEKVMASFLYLSCSPLSSSLSFFSRDLFFLLTFLFFFFLRIRINLLVWVTLAVSGSATAETFRECRFRLLEAPTLQHNSSVFQNFALPWNEEERRLFGSYCTRNVSCCRIEHFTGLLKETKHSTCQSSHLWLSYQLAIFVSHDH